jgi:hypothetical protein
MRKAMYGMAGALAVAIAPAWASDVSAGEKGTGNAAASRESTRMAAKTAAPKRVSKGVSEGGTGSAVPAANDGVELQPIDVNAPHAERWLVEREGYRDGGY